MGNYVGASVSVSAEIEPDHEYKAFLANSSNKQALINHLVEYMANVDITVQHAEGDSEYKICTVACRSAQADCVIADDTDIFSQLWLSCSGLFQTLPIAG